MTGGGELDAEDSATGGDIVAGAGRGQGAWILDDTGGNDDTGELHWWWVLGGDMYWMTLCRVPLVVRMT